MTDFSFLAYLPDPFVVQESLYFVKKSDGSVHSMSASELSAYSAPLITYDVPALVDDLRRMQEQPPKRILDIGDALRLTIALAKDDGGERGWEQWSALKKFFDVSADGNRFHRIVESREKWPERKEQSRLLREALEALERQWIGLSEELQGLGEFNRLISVEWPLHRIFAYRQSIGISVDSSGARNLLDQIAAEKYSAYREVAETLRKSPTGLTFWNIHPYLNRTDVAHLTEVDPGGRLQDAFELAAPHSKFASSFLSLVKAGRDEAIVKRAVGGDDRIYPIFHILGTVSGRILVSDPYLQQLRRTYRSLVTPEPKSRLVYLDYAQFEPGVLAGLSEDRSLTEAYNGGDVYIALAEALFRDGGARAIAKRVFLAFSYGMTTERIATLLAGSDNSLCERRNYERKIEQFFRRYSGLEVYRSSQEKKLLDAGAVSSLLGNRRQRTGSGALSWKEKRWALNHPVQSTASLVFKEGLVDVARELGEDKIILPMHDAILLQLGEDDDIDRNIELAVDLMVTAFSRRLPSIRARVTVSSFAE